MTVRTRIKMCGFTRQEDVIAAINAGADAIGLNFYPPSPRSISLEQGQFLAAQCGSLVKSVALFVDEDAGRVRDVVQAVKPDLLQFHGAETPDYCQQFGLRYIKALRVQTQADIIAGAQQHAQAEALLLDAYVKGVPGGTGQQFDWSMIPANLTGRLLLAGGLNADNVSAAIAQVRPYAVDVSGGIELAKGIKSGEKIIRFAAAVRAADCQ